MCRRVCKYTVLSHTWGSAVAAFLSRFEIALRFRRGSSSDFVLRNACTRRIITFYECALHLDAFGRIGTQEWHCRAELFSVKATRRATYFSSRNDTVCPSASRSSLAGTLKKCSNIIQCCVGDLNESPILLLFILI